VTAVITALAVSALLIMVVAGTRLYCRFDARHGGRVARRGRAAAAAVRGGSGHP
jgi:hypothetical protein